MWVRLCSLPSLRNNSIYSKSFHGLTVVEAFLYEEGRKRDWGIDNRERVCYTGNSKMGRYGDDGMTTVMIDGGTTNTRLTLVRGNEIVCRRECPVGAGSTGDDLQACVRAELAALERKVPVDRICIAGMITSEKGLVEIPHIAAPAGVADLAAAVRTVSLPDVTKEPVLCIPGVKTLGKSAEKCDMMRGEETEVMGDLWERPARGRRLYVHFGSHNKAILVENGRIRSSVTTISGELLSAVLRETIVGSSAGGLEGFRLDPEAAVKGCRLCAENGLSRALFQGRLAAVLGGEKQVLSMIIGMLCREDAMAFAPILREEMDELVLYGRDAFIEGFMACRKEMTPQIPVRVIGHEESRWLSVKGMMAVLRQKEKEEHA